MKAAPTRFATPYGVFQLQRYPARSSEPLQAWCAADTLLLEEAFRLGVTGASTLVVNDSHGALCLPLQAAALWSDSALAAIALQRNNRVNGTTSTPVIWSTQEPPANKRYIVLRVPKQLHYFEYQLSCLARQMTPGSHLLAAGMDKHMSPRTAQLIEHYIGPTQRHPGSRKARLFSALRDERNPPAPAQITTYFCESLQAQLEALPNCFSRDGLDIGSRFLLDQLHRLQPAQRVIDLACGNGVLGLAAFRAGLACEVVFCDESAMAIGSARKNATSLQRANPPHCSFHHGDGLQDYTGEPADLILCNPPFHLEHTVDEYAGRRLISQCRKSLSAQGRLCLVANSHLNYMPVLRRDFGSVEKLAANRKFTIYLAGRPCA